MKDVGEKIRIQRLTKKYSQEYMAFELGISQAAYSKIETDQTELTIQRVFDIAEILEINAFLLMPKPKYGASIHFAYHQIIAKLRKFWRWLSSSGNKEKLKSAKEAKGH